MLITKCVGDYYGYWRQIPTASVWLEIQSEYKFKHEVLVVPRDCPHQVPLGNDLTMFDELFKLSQVQNQSQIKVVTRAEAKRRRENDEINKVLDRKDGAQPVPNELDEQTFRESPSECPDLSEPTWMIKVTW